MASILNFSFRVQVLLRFLSYLCWSWDDLPAHCERVCSTGRHTFLGNNVASHSQQEGKLVLGQSLRKQSSWTAGLQGKDSYNHPSFILTPINITTCNQVANLEIPD